MLSEKATFTIAGTNVARQSRYHVTANHYVCDYSDSP